MNERYKLYNYAMPEYETLIIDTKTNNFVKYSKLLEIINHTDISEFVIFLKELVKYSNSTHTKPERYAHIKGSIVLKIQDLEKRLPDATGREKRAK